MSDGYWNTHLGEEFYHRSASCLRRKRSKDVHLIDVFSDSPRDASAEKHHPHQEASSDEQGGRNGKLFHGWNDRADEPLDYPLDEERYPVICSDDSGGAIIIDDKD